MKTSNKIIIIGTGPAALMAGTILVEQGYCISFYEQKKAAGRKFLVAGHGGFNLSNSIAKDAFLAMYDRVEIQQIVNAFDAEDLVLFLQKIEIPTYIGSSGKVFPEKHIKPIDVLNAWLNYLKNKGAVFNFESQMIDFDDQFVWIQHNESISKIAYSKLILALGGASWAKTGSTGAWQSIFESKGIATKHFFASNAGFNINLPAIIKPLEGQPIKHLLCKLGEKEKYGEIVLTEYGFEGAPIFFLNAAFRNGNATLIIDAKPSFSLEKIEQVLINAKSNSEGLKQLKISKILILYIKEKLPKANFLNVSSLAFFIKNIPFTIESLRPIDEAISTVGGLAFDAVNTDLSLKEFPDIYCCGEMLDWDAPTGGYLLQACFASGVWAAKNIKKGFE